MAHREWQGPSSLPPASMLPQKTWAYCRPERAKMGSMVRPEPVYWPEPLQQRMRRLSCRPTCLIPCGDLAHRGVGTMRSMIAKTVPSQG